MAERNGYSDFMATEFVDRGHLAHYRALFEEHHRQELRTVARFRAEVVHLAQNRQISDARYAQRMKSIEEKRDRIAERLHSQHNSIRGKIAARLPGGREKQAAELERLDQRSVQLQGRATRLYEGLSERQLKNQVDQTHLYAHQMKHIRQDHQEARQAMQRTHEQSRPQQIEDRKQAVWKAAEQQLRHALQHEQTKQHEQGRAHGR